MKGPKIPAFPENASHPAPEALFEAASGQGDASSRIEIERHAATCSRCSAELSHIEAFRAAPPMGQSAREAAWRKFAEPRLPYPRRRFPARALLAAVAAIASAVALPILLKSTSSPREITRGSSEALSLVSPTGSVDRVPQEFRFRNPSGLLVRVSIFDADRSFNWTSESTTSEQVGLPADQRSRLESEREYFWTLVAPGSPAPVASFRVTRGASLP